MSMKLFAAYAVAVQRKPHNAYYERPAIRALVPDLRDKRVLDAGCGPGTNIDWLLEQGTAQVTGVDASPRMIEIAGRQPGRTFASALPI
jgi:2-polyprenyl-3-methyl-5-hydroxy-6-metoxy-1,4-benzoquinol methylase